MCTGSSTDQAHDRACALRVAPGWAVPQPRIERHGGPVAEEPPEPGPVSVPAGAGTGGRLSAEPRAVVAEQVAAQRAAGRTWAEIAAEFGRTPAWALTIARLAKG
jgi:hypothetical protein